jgi:hypothetical protein
MSTRTLSEADIVAQILDGPQASFGESEARAILRLRFTDAHVSRMHQLADRNREGVLTADERRELDNFLRVGNFLDSMQLKAKLMLKQLSESAA